MELSGKIIIFDSDTDAKVWFQTIKEVQKNADVESARQRCEDYVNTKGVSR